MLSEGNAVEFLGFRSLSCNYAAMQKRPKKKLGKPWWVVCKLLTEPSKPSASFDSGVKLRHSCRVVLHQSRNNLLCYVFWFCYWGFFRSGWAYALISWVSCDTLATRVAAVYLTQLGTVRLDAQWPAEDSSRLSSCSGCVQVADARATAAASR